MKGMPSPQRKLLEPGRRGKGRVLDLTFDSMLAGFAPSSSSWIWETEGLDDPEANTGGDANEFTGVGAAVSGEGNEGRRRD